MFNSFALIGQAVLEVWPLGWRNACMMNGNNNLYFGFA
jgi:hypothetical protein